MPLILKLCCDGCGKSFELAEIERLANVYKTLTRDTRKKNVVNVCTKCGARKGTTNLEENYICNQCKIREEKAKRKFNQRKALQNLAVTLSKSKEKKKQARKTPPKEYKEQREYREEVDDYGKEKENEYT